MSSIAERIAQLTPEQRKLIALRRQKQAEAKSRETAIQPLSGEGPWPASVDQTALWFLHKLNPDGKGYNINSCARIEGPFDPQTLQRSFNHIVARHEILRTSFTEIDGVPYQVVHPHMATPITHKDVSHLPKEKRGTAARAEIAAFVTPFDHETGPLVRMQLIRLDEEDYVVQAMFDHTTIDWWSFQIFFNELWVGYISEMEGKAPDLAPMPIQFRDYAVHRNQWLESDGYKQSIEFWKKKLHGAPPLLDIATDRPRPAAPNYRGSMQRFQVPLETLERLRQVASKANCSSLMSLLAVTFAFLSRYTGQKDLLIGTTITNRDREETHLMMGYLLNILVMRGRLDENPSFLQMLDQVRSTVLEAFDHKEIPFRKLVEELNPERDLSRMPLYQVEFIYVTTGGPTIAHQKSSEVAAIPTPFSHTNFEYDRQTSAIDLQIAFSESPTGLELMVEYMTDLFHAETIRRMGHLIVQLLDGLVRHPNTPIAEVPWLSQSDRQQLLVSWNQTQQPWPSSATALELIERQADQAPQQLAVRSQGVNLTYAQLNAKADQIANGLQARGIGLESRVAVMLTRGPDLIPVLLGIWKAGAAYVPLDPTHPQERLAYIAEDAGVQLYIADPGKRFSGSAPTVTCQDLLQDSSPSPATSSPEPLSAAYLIYTSGSTGRPKGVTVSHGALANFLKTMTTQPGLQAGETLLAVTTLAFDIAGLELYLPLMNGATVVLADADTTADGRLLATMLEAEEIDVIQATPATFRLLYESGWQGRRAMRVFCGGEALPDDLARMLLRDCAQVWNLYGPTETTIWSTRTKITEGEPVHLGHPIGNTQCYVVNPQQKPTPAGVPGELLIGGDGLARGYWQKPGLTAERFVPDPFSQTPGQRLYRTGDLVRYRPDGSLLFLGRIDFQVKMRGYRIELEEISSQLAHHPQIDQAVVTAFEDAAGANLAAYYLAPHALEAETLRSFLGARLPSYMVPAFFIHMENFPLTANGKINRRALPKPDAHGQRAAYVAPTSELEKILAEVWESILGSETIGVHDSFFLLGGHSLLATQVASRIREKTGRDIPLKKIFDQPTIAELAQYLETAATSDEKPPLKWIARGKDYPLSFAQERMWFLHQLNPQNAIYNMPIPLTFQGALNRPVLERALQELLKRHEVFRSRFFETDQGPRQQMVAQAEFQLHFHDLRQSVREDWEEVLHPQLTRAAQEPFDLEKGPLIRFHLFQTDAQRFHLLMVMHHIISDGWSLGILFRELAALYAAYAKGQASPLNELRVHYLDYTVWLRNWLTEERLNRTLDFWRETLADVPAAIELPYDFPRPPLQTYQGRVHDVWLGKDVASAVESVSRRYGVTPFMTLLSVYGALLSRYSGQEDLCIGTPVANRGESETESMAGLFINTLVLRLDLTEAPSLKELLARVRETTLSAFSHQETPFEKVVEALVPVRNPSISPLFQTFFSLETLGLEAAASQSMPDVSMEVMDIAVEQAKFDLSLNTFLSGGRLRLNLEFNTDLFNPETIAQFAEHFGILLRNLLQNPEVPIRDLPIMSATDTQELVSHCAPKPTDYPRDTSLGQVFENQVAATPTKIAITEGARSLTYAELNTLANRFSHQFRAMGVGYQDVIVLALPSSIEVIAMILATVKLGAVYLPLDPEHPPQRIGWMADDAQAKLVVCESSLQIPGQRRWDPSDLDPNLAASNPDEDIHPLQGAHILYTSGSTGEPKGVLIPHRGVMRLVKNNHYMSLGSDVCMLQISTLAFDAATFEIWGCLLNGGRLVLHPRKALDTLPQTIKNQSVNTAFFTPQLFNLLMDEMPEAFAGMTQIASGGEALSVKHVTEFRKRYPEIRLVNAYGPTETSVFATTACLNETGLTPFSVPIGEPIANSSAYVLDGHFRTLPRGVFGELCLGGDGLALGYWRRARHTATAFVPNPFASAENPGSRLYRTGDRVRLLLSGLLEFGARLDRQVKLRGFRLELGEIENRLKECQGVRSAAVLFDAPQQRLVAYIVGVEEDQQNRLREHLATYLPDYMVPTAWAFLSQFPLTRNGKLDTRALLAVPLASEPLAERRPPATETERAVASIWQGLLNTDAIGLDDNFFTMGGHSLLATRAVTRLRDRFQIEVPLQAVFQYPTVENFSRFIDISLLGLQESDDTEMDMEEGAI